MEERVRALIKRLESWEPSTNSDPVREHWFNCGMDEAYDNVIDWLYHDVLQEGR